MTSDKKLAPVALFVYNRPQHTQKTLEALQNNKLSPQTTLYIFSDGPKVNASPKELELIRETRKIIRTENWCGYVKIIESEINKGLASSIIDGVSLVLESHSKIIVLEDDLTTSPFFLKFMNESLEYYGNYVGVFSISGFNLPPDKLPMPADYSFDVFVSLRNSSWGWATWRNRWEKVSWNIRNFNDFLFNDAIKEAFMRGGNDLLNAFKKQLEGKIDSWAIRFAFAHFQHHSISIFPRYSYVENIGMDGSGVHCLPTLKYKNDLNRALENYKFLDILYEDKRIINGMKHFYSDKKWPLIIRVINKLYQILFKTRLVKLKEKVYI